MDKVEVHKLYELAKVRWGVTAQIDVAIEECCELNKELCKAKRGNINIKQLADELADMRIMVEQLEQIFGCDSLVRVIRSQKLERLAGRLKIGEAEAE